MKISLAILPMLAAPLLCAYTFSRPAQAAPTKSTKGYSLQAPAGWKLQKPGPMASDMMIMAAPRNGFAANINVVVTPRENGMTLEGAKTQLPAMYRKMFTSFKLIGQKTIPFQGGRALQIDATYQMGSPAKTIRLQQIAALHGKSAFIFTATVLNADFKTYQPRFKSIFDSVRWTK